MIKFSREGGICEYIDIDSDGSISRSESKVGSLSKLSDEHKCRIVCYNVSNNMLLIDACSGIMAVPDFLLLEGIKSEVSRYYKLAKRIRANILRDILFNSFHDSEKGEYKNIPSYIKMLDVDISDEECSVPTGIHVDK